MTHHAAPAEEGWRLAFDVGTVRHEPTGVGVYARNLAAELARTLPGRLSVIGVRPGGLDGEVPADVARTPFRGVNYQSWLQARAAGDSRRTGADLAHFTNATAPLATRLPYVLTVHDISVARMPHYHPALRVATLPISVVGVARARAILVPSRSTARELARLSGRAARQVAVVEYAASTDQAAAAGDEALMRRLGIGGAPYLLALGTVEPRKNHRRLIGAFERLAAEDGDLRLVIVGHVGWRARAIRERAAASPFAERIVWAGYVSDGEMAALIAGSRVVCYVSLYEGYGLPIVEAMAVGAAVVTSRVSSMPEAAGGAAVLVDPRDEGDIARGIGEALARRPELIDAGRRRAAMRSWRDVALETIDVYRWALGR